MPDERYVIDVLVGIALNLLTLHAPLWNNPNK